MHVKIGVFQRPIFIKKLQLTNFNFFAKLFEYKYEWLDLLMPPSGVIMYLEMIIRYIFSLWHIIFARYLKILATVT